MQITPSHSDRPSKYSWLAAIPLALLPSPALASGGAMNSLLADWAFCLALAGIIAVFFVRLKIPTIAAFIVAGIIAGPLGIARVTDAANIDAMAQLGLILLLFTIGLETDLNELRKGGRTILIAGLLQFPLTVLFGFLTAKAFAASGIVGSLMDGGLAPLYIGATIAGSSTLLVVKMFQDALEIDTVPGRVSLGILIFQDLWAIVLIIIQPNLNAPQILPVLSSFVGIGLLAAVATGLGRFALPVGLKWVAKSPETIVLAALGFCFVVVLGGQSLDHLVPAAYHDKLELTVGAGMSALIAGIVLASLPYTHELGSKVGVLKDFFVTLFFVSLGISIPAPTSWDIPILAVLIAITSSVSRLVIFFPLLYYAGLDRRNATVTSVRLAQISEFALVVVVLGLDLGQLSREQGSAIILAFVLTALATAPLYRLAYSIHEWLSPALLRLGFREPEAHGHHDDSGPRIVLLGFHRVASALLTELASKDPAIVREILVVDFNVTLHDKIRAQGASAVYGDFSRPETLIQAKIDSAKLIISTVPDDLMRGIDNRRLVELIRTMNPSAEIIANTLTLAEAPRIYEAGANFVYANHVETAQALAPVILQAMNGRLADCRAAEIASTGPLDQRPDVLR